MKCKEIFLSDLNYEYLLNFVGASVDNFTEEKLEVFNNIYDNVSYFVESDDDSINQTLHILCCLINDLNKLS